MACEIMFFSQALFFYIIERKESFKMSANTNVVDLSMRVTADTTAAAEELKKL
jgi:hypothetical protein